MPSFHIHRHFIDGREDSAVAQQFLPEYPKITWVTGERFVRALAIEHDLDSLLRSLAHERVAHERRHGMHRLVMKPQHFFQAVP